MNGWVESMNDSIGYGNSELIDPLAKVEIIDCNPTTRSRVTSGASLNETPFSKKREASYPPNVRLPKTPLTPVEVSQHLERFQRRSFRSMELGRPSI